MVLNSRTSGLWTRKHQDGNITRATWRGRPCLNTYAVYITTTTTTITMSSTPSTDAEWKDHIENLKGRLPSTCETHQAVIPLGVHRMIDHTLITTPIDPSQIDKLCAEAREHDFVAVCVRPEHIARAVGNLSETPNTVVACVVSFPEGMDDTADKVHEAEQAVAQGATELDLVIKYPLLKEGRYTAVYDDILAVRRAAPAPIKLKTIVETSQLSCDELTAAVIICCTAGADFVKTSTGFKGTGATAANVTKMCTVANLCSKACKVKASGGLRSAQDCLRMLKAGAQRIGTSAGVKIVMELEEGELLEQGASHAVS